VTCPACNRPLATAAHVASVERGDEWMSDSACYAAALEADPTCDGEIDAVALLAMARCIPPRALRELARVLKFGGEKHGAKACEPSRDQTAADHIAHARGHGMCATGQPLARDRDTGALHLIHAACRAVLAAELVLAGEETGR